MAGLNKIMIIGNVGTDPEMRYTPNGSPVTSFRIATSRSYNAQDGERRQETEWFTVVAWNNLAEQVNQYLSKGRRAYVEGRLQSHTYQGNDGQTRFRNEIVANRVLFLDRAGSNEDRSGSNEDRSGSNEQGSEAFAAAPGDFEAADPPGSPDDLPF